MLQLTYISTAARDLPETAVSDILKASRRRNAAVGVTGLLLYDGRRFLQTLEGDVQAIQGTYDRIRADPRHRACVLLSSQDVSERSFANWAMAAANVAELSSSVKIADQVDQLTEAISDKNLREHFRSFARVRAGV